MGADEELVPRSVQMACDDIAEMSLIDEGSIVRMPTPGLVRGAEELYLNPNEKGMCLAGVDKLSGMLVGFQEAAEANAAQKAAFAAVAAPAAPVEPAPTDVAKHGQGVLKPRDRSHAIPEDDAQEDFIPPEPVLEEEERHREMEKNRLDEQRPVAGEPASSLQHIKNIDSMLAPEAPTHAAKSKLEAQGEFGADSANSAAAASETTRAMPVGGYAAAHNQASVSFELLLSDLEAAELQTYNEVWAKFAGGAGSVPLDSKPLRSILLQKTCIAEEELDTQLIQAAPDLALTRTGFLHLVREHTLADAVALELFVQLSPDGEAVPRAALSQNLPEFLSEQLGFRLPEEYWKEVVTAASSGAGELLNLEQWLTCCKKAARLARLMKHLGD